MDAREAVLALATHDLVRKGVTTLPLSRRVAERFVAGETVEDAIKALRRISEQGLCATIDHLGEGTTDVDGAARAADSYLELLDALSAADLVEHAEVSVKLTAVGLALDDGVEVAFANAARIAKAAAAAGTTMTIDMEDHTHTEQTLQLVERLRAEQPDVGAVLQAYLHRTDDDVKRLAHPGSRVRLCKGAYREPVDVAFQQRAEISAAFSRCLSVLMAGGGYPMVATHDPQLIELALSLAARNDKGPGSFEFQLLNGVRTEEQLRLVGLGHRVRVYLPYGTQWYGYMMRRMAEKPANLALFVRSLTSRR